MRRRSIRHAELNNCPMCRKVVEYGMQCEACASWFHATEQCCGDALANAFTTAGRDAWTCLNCYHQQGAALASNEHQKPAAAIDHIDWRRAFRILTDSCAGCGLKVREGALAFRCDTCDVAYHAHERCTGYDEHELPRRIAEHGLAGDRATGGALLAIGGAAEGTGTALANGDAPPSSSDACGSAPGSASDAPAGPRPWRCPTCMVHATGSAIEGSRVNDDVSGGQEAAPIPLLNEVDAETEVQLSTGAGSFEYAKLCVWRHPRAIEQKLKLPFADWGGRCIFDEATAWLPGTDESGGAPVKRDGGGGAAYNREGQLLFARDCIFECNGSCACPPECPNRVVGRGVALPLQVVKTVGRGWGVRSRHKIGAGSFICEYTGNMLLDSDAEASGLEIDDSYLFNLDGEEKGQVSKRRRTGSAANVSNHAQTAKNPDLAADASRIGSVARFFNHCCEPNLFVQSVFIEYSRRVHRIALFAARDILPYEELTYDYGYVVGSVEGKSLRCLCGAPSCRGYLF